MTDLSGSPTARTPGYEVTAAGPTPGPWSISALDPHVIGPTRLVRMDKNSDAIPQLLAVARVYYRFDETQANANLIAAAPDLLASLKEMRDAAAAMMRVIAMHERGIAEEFGREIHRIGITDGFGVRAQDAIQRAEGQ